MRVRSYRRHQADRHMWRRLKEDRNQHYDRLDCPCWTDPRAMARFKEQPAVCSNPFCCGNPRRVRGKHKDALTIQERRFNCTEE
jgi:hypothetical protein